tara:strand:- start:663 stop:1922 length:1260 start_codon:yes stop_codon:yes gene_type:complete
MNNQIITSIDIGTTKIAVIIAEKNNNSLNILGFGEEESRGLDKGVVVNIKRTVASLKNALDMAEKQAEYEIDTAYIGLTGENIKGINCSGAITISNSDYLNPAGEVITKKDINKVLDHAKAINLSPDRKILHVLSQNFKVDERDGIKDPEGLSGHRLEAKVHLVTISRNIEKDLTTCLELCGLDVSGFILEPLASSHSILDKDEKELGTVLVDIGGGTSDIIVYHNNSILHTGAISLGGENLTKDIAYGLQTSIDQAEIIKCEYGIAKTALSNDEKRLSVKGTNGREEKEISETEIAHIIEPRMREIFHLIKNEIRKSEKHNDLTFGIVLTGGGSNLKNIIELAEEVFELKVKKGIPDSINGIVDIINNPRYATVIGIAKYVLTKNEIIDTSFGDYEENNLFEIIKNKLNKLINFIKLK